MRTFLVLLTVIVLTVSLGSTVLSQDTAADAEAIEMLAAKYEEGWKNGDAQATASIYAADADIIDFMGRSFKGREEIEKSIAEVFTMFEGSQIELERTSIRFLRPDLAVWDGIWEITGLPEAEGDAPPTKGLSTVVAVKQEGQWLLAYGLSSVPPPPPTTDQSQP
jgi:uncharacterized protein (TIGR02246 family)